MRNAMLLNDTQLNMVVGGGRGRAFEKLLRYLVKLVWKQFHNKRKD